MPVPYEPVIRHAWSPGDVVCHPCHAQQPNEPCGVRWCVCACNALLDDTPEDYGDRDAPLPDTDGPEATDEQHAAYARAAMGEPPAGPEPLASWGVPVEATEPHDTDTPAGEVPARLTYYPTLLGMDTIVFDRERYFRLDTWLRVLGLLMAVLQLFVFYLVTSRDTDGTWAEAVVVIGTVTTAAFLFATTLIRPMEWRPSKKHKSS